MPNAGYGDRLIFPLSPQEMDTELLGDPEAQTVNPYCESSREYQGIPQSSYAMDNEHTQRQSIAKPMRRLGPHPNRRSSHTNESNRRITELSDDPEYLDFLRYKRYVHSDRGPDEDPESGIEGFSGSQNTLTSPNEQFNELLLYLFTGFFLLMLYDNIYKLGRDAY